jgi:integrase
LVEHLTENQGVAGSNPALGTIALQSPNFVLKSGFFTKRRPTLNHQKWLFMAKQPREVGAEREPLTRGGVFQMIDVLATRAGVSGPSRGKSSGIHPHLFRHSMATQWLSDNGNPLMLQKVLGHSNLNMISKVYAHLNTSDTYAELMRLRSKREGLTTLRGRRSA